MTTTAVGSTAPSQTTGSTTNSASESSNSTDQSDSLANEDVFLQLLVAQLQNQDPENPADGTQFVTQLAQFTTLQEQTESRTDLDSILQTLQTMSAAQTSSSSSGSTSDSGSTSSNGSNGTSNTSN